MSGYGTESRNTGGGGIGLAGALFVLFLGLKLAEVGPVQYWSWWWVTAPLWVPFALITAVALVFFIGRGIYNQLPRQRRRRQAREALMDAVLKAAVSRKRQAGR